jgi:hypothetical protein
MDRSEPNVDCNPQLKGTESRDDNQVTRESVVKMRRRSVCVPNLKLVLAD